MLMYVACQLMSQEFSTLFLSMPYRETYLYLLFAGVINSMSAVFVKVARFVDYRKEVGMSCEVLISSACDLFFAIFYRLLFFEINQFQSFFLVKLVHFTIESCNHVFRMTLFYHRISGKVQDYFRRSAVLKLLVDDSTHDQFVTRQTIEFGSRRLAYVFSILSVIMSLLVVKGIGYNDKQFRTFERVKNYQTQLEFLAASACLEILFVCFVESWLGTSSHPGIMSVMNHLSVRFPQFVAAFAVTASHVYSDILLATLIIQTTG